MNTVRIVKENDLAQIAKIHKQQFADHYLGNFSEKLLLKFYESFYNDKNIVFIVYEDQIGIRGFIVGGNLHRINNASSALSRASLAAVNTAHNGSIFGGE